MPKRKLPPNDELIRLYESGLSGPDIAELYGTTAATVMGGLKRAGARARTGSEAQRLRFARGAEPNRYWLGKKQPRDMVERRVAPIRGEAHWNWKGGVSDARAYRRLVTKEQCACCGGKERLAVHHRNNDHYDHSPENLMVVCLSCHSSIHKQAYWDAIHRGEEPPKSNAPNNWKKGGEA